MPDVVPEDGVQPSPQLPPHVTVTESDCTDSEYVPARQSVQAPDPATALNFPATHAVHCPPSGPVEPGSQGAGVYEIKSVPTFQNQNESNVKEK